MSLAFVATSKKSKALVAELNSIPADIFCPARTIEYRDVSLIMTFSKLSIDSASEYGKFLSAKWLREVLVVEKR